MSQVTGSYMKYFARLSSVALLVVNLGSLRPAYAQEAVAGEDKWSATDENRDFEVEILTYEEVAALSPSDRSAYLVGLQDILLNAAVVQDMDEDTPVVITREDGRGRFDTALTWIDSLLETAHAADPNESVDEARTETEIANIKKVMDPNSPTGLCNPANKAPYVGMACADAKAQLAQEQTDLAAFQKLRVSGQVGDTTKYEQAIKAAKARAIANHCDDKFMEADQKNQCEAAQVIISTNQNSINKLKAHPESARDANAVARWKKAIDDREKQAVALVFANADKCAKESDATKRSACEIAGQKAVEAIYKKQDDDKVRLAIAERKDKADQKPPVASKDTTTSANWKLGKGCKAGMKALTCPAATSKEARAQARAALAKRIQEENDCKAGKENSQCLNTRKMNIGSMKLACHEAGKVMCPLVYGAEKDESGGWKALCADKPENVSYKKQIKAVHADCKRQSTPETRQFVAQAIPGMKEAWEHGVRGPVMSACGGPKHVKENCGVCSQMGADAQVAIAASGKDRNCKDSGGSGKAVDGSSVQ